jgi:hypothetical protein
MMVLWHQNPMKVSFFILLQLKKHVDQNSIEDELLQFLYKKIYFSKETNLLLDPMLRPILW